MDDVARLAVPLLPYLPWLLFFLHFVFRLRLPRQLPPAPAWGGPDAAGERAVDLASGNSSRLAPLVTVVIPARNEAHNIGRVLETVTASHYPAFDVLVVDDRSEDRTGALARAVPPRRAQHLEVLEGEPLPEGWLGKPWACFQGARQARGELLLFTDADTAHEPDLLSRAVAGLEQDGADALTVLGRQLMGSFWERLAQPQIFVMMLARFINTRDPLPPRRWRDAVANGQYLLVRRQVYDRLGGHAAVRGDVVEDQRIAQLLVAGGWKLSTRGAEDGLTTRMYRGLEELVQGWSKNMNIGARMSVPTAVRPFLIPVSLILLVALWLLPPTTLAAALLGAGGSALLVWSATVVLASVVFWGAFTARMGAPFAYGLLYPLGSAVVGWTLLRSWWWGTRVEWKGREYRVREPGG